MNRIHLVTPLIKIIYSSLDSCLPSYQNLSIRCMLQSKNSIDQQKIGTKSRISFLQYMPKNLKIWCQDLGVMIWASVSGYCLSFQIYTRKTDKAVQHRLSYCMVFDLLQRFLGEGHHVFFITSIPAIN